MEKKNPVNVTFWLYTIYFLWANFVVNYVAAHKISEIRRLGTRLHICTGSRLHCFIFSAQLAGRLGPHFCIFPKIAEGNARWVSKLPKLPQTELLSLQWLLLPPPLFLLLQRNMTFSWASEVRTPAQILQTICTQLWTPAQILYSKLPIWHSKILAS